VKIRVSYTVDIDAEAWNADFGPGAPSPPATMATTSRASTTSRDRRSEMESNPEMLEAYRLQCENAERLGVPVEAIYLMWRGQDDVTEDDLIDVMKEVTSPRK